MIARIPHKNLAAVVLAFLSFTIQAADWASYGGDNGSRKYFPLDQINASNVSELTTAWNWSSVDNATVANNIRISTRRPIATRARLQLQLQLQAQTKAVCHRP